MMKKQRPLFTECTFWRPPSVVTFENLLKFDKGEDIPTNYWNGTIPSGYTQTKVEAASSDPF